LVTTVLAVARRCALLVASLLVSSLLVFILLRLLPGDIARTKLGMFATNEEVEALRAQLGLDRSLPVQYLEWLGNAVRGDLGTSMISGASVGGELVAKSAVTVPLIAAASVLAFLVAVPVGMYAGVRRRSWRGATVSGIGQLGVAVPTFWIGVLLITAFAVTLQWLPSGGFPVDSWRDVGGAVRSMILPTITLALAQGAVLMRYSRSATIDVLNTEWFRTARRVHGVRNVLSPVVSVLGVQLATLVVGAIIVESVFALPGVGQMLLQDVSQRDVIKVQGTVAVTTALVFLVGFAVDGALRLIDPRTRDRA
jgi:peptide/nickel transport system permease protein